MKIYLVILLGIFLIHSSCTPVYYASNSPNVALFQKKGEVQLEGGFATADPLYGGEFQGAVAVTDHFLIHGNAFFVSNDNNESTIENWYSENGKFNLFEIGGGYYTKMANNDFIFEATGGYGGGTSELVDDQLATYRFGLNKFYIQPAFGYAKRKIEVGGALRINYVHYNLKESSGNTGIPQIDEVYDNPYVWSIDPGMFVRGGWDQFKFQMKLTFPIILAAPEVLTILPVATFGIVYHNKYSKKK